MTTQELINQLSKMPPGYEVNVVLDFNEYLNGEDSDMDIDEILTAGMPCTLFLNEAHENVHIITIPMPEMEKVWDLARNITLKFN